MKSLIQRFIRDDKKVLGRWNLDYCNKKMDKKIDLANEDHCGPCGEYALNTTITDIGKHTNKQYHKIIDKNLIKPNKT